MQATFVFVDGTLVWAVDDAVPAVPVWTVDDAVPAVPDWDADGVPAVVCAQTLIVKLRANRALRRIRDSTDVVIDCISILFVLRRDGFFRFIISSSDGITEFICEWTTMYIVRILAVKYKYRGRNRMLTIL